MKLIIKFCAVSVMMLFVFTSCNKDELNIEEPGVKSTKDLQNKASEQGIVEIVHNYDYYGEKFKVLYVLDTKESEVVKVDGDVQMAERIFGKKDSPQGLFFEDQKEGETTINVKVFNTNDEVDEYIVKLAGDFPKERSEQQVTKGACVDGSINGTGNFYFYYHINYVTEMTGIRRTNKYYYKDWNLGGYNDHMSSLRLTKPWGRRAYVRLYQHSCYNGRTLNFYSPYYQTVAGANDLRNYTLSGWWFWKKSWNDKTSSYRVWAW
ncbi:hypothetical protein [Aquimarina megaterium]|uniref:hypothetical protein n=1 Tax=Aquimarina megaterium TaxID=1443666 RepID=UPI0004BC624D|nr:hypothetical protein [Aquimarina megaterium]